VNPGNAALGRGLDALLALSTPDAARNGLGVSQLADLLRVDKSQMSRTLATLADRGFVTRDPDTLAFRLGWRLFSLAALSGDAPLIAAARPVLLSLVAELGESAHLSVRQGDQVLTLATESPAVAIHAPGRVGGLTPLATTSAGRALATGFSDDEVVAAGLTRWTDQIANARTQGFAIVREEFEAGLVSVAAPIHDAAGQVIAAINVSAPSFRFESRLDDAAPIVTQAAETIGATLGGTVTV
jgi:IclR family KDG regulon transcriptional repressor